MDISLIQSYLNASNLDAWLIYDYHNINPVFGEVLGPHHATRRTFLMVPADGEPVLLLHYVDVGQFDDIQTSVYLDRTEMKEALQQMLSGRRRVALEYSPMGELPNTSYVDAGTMELIRSLGVTPVSSADLYQQVCARWTAEQLQLHRVAAAKLGLILDRVFAYLRANVGRITEYDLQLFIQQEFAVEKLEAPDGPVVAVNAHASDPHFAPSPEQSAVLDWGDWLLIDLWAREPEGVYADATWVAHIGRDATPEQRAVFAVVKGARDRAFAYLRQSFERGETVQGWQVDAVARDFITAQGYGPYFTHRLGHSLGTAVHGRAVNLDGFETRDTRRVIEGIGLTIEPGIYLPEFGVRSEIDVYMSPDGPVITTPLQEDIVLIG